MFLKTYKRYPEFVALLVQAHRKLEAHGQRFVYHLSSEISYKGIIVLYRLDVRNKRDNLPPNDQPPMQLLYITTLRLPGAVTTEPRRSVGGVLTT